MKIFTEKLDIYINSLYFYTCFKNNIIMKKLLLLLIVLLPIEIFPQTYTWVPINCGTNKLLGGVYCLNDDTAFVVGEMGTIRRTTDGGWTWDSINSGTTQDLGEINFTDNLTGYISGTNNTFLKSIDGGQTWISKDVGLGSMYCLTELNFVNKDTGWMLAGNDFLLKTEDAGETWVKDTSIGNAYALTSICFIDTDTGYASGYKFTDQEEALFKTINGGLTWTIVSQISGVNMRFYSPEIGYIAGTADIYYSYLYQTTDYGKTWNIIADYINDYGIYRNWAICILDSCNVISSWVEMPGSGLVLENFCTGSQNFVDNESVYAMDFTPNGEGYVVGYGFPGSWYGTGYQMAKRAVVTNTTTTLSDQTKVFPNPVIDKTHIKLADGKNNKVMNVTVYNSIGVKQLSYSYIEDHNGEIEIDLYDLDPGFYFMTLQMQNNSSKTFKIIKL